jgi:lysophospholipase L1-like esterase
MRKSTSPEFAPQKLVISELADLPINKYDCSLAFEFFDGDSEDLFLYGDGIHFSNAGHRLLAFYLLENSEILGVNKQ